MSDARTSRPPGRRSNLSMVLRLLHADGARSRAQLTDATGLNRSTVADLVAELEQRGLAIESDPVATRQVGRPSPIVSANPRVVAFAVNPEVDSITVARVGLDGVVQERVRHDSDRVPSAAEAAAIAAQLVTRLSPTAGERVVGVGVAVPGLVREDDGLVRLAPHLGWTDTPFAELVADATGLPTRAANDANLGVLAERLLGSGRGVDDLVYLNGGASGVGGGVVLGGHSIGGRDGYAGELGHTLVNPSGRACHCGGTGCLETEVGQDDLLRVTGRDNTDDLDRALQSSDPAVVAEVERQIDQLGIALRNIVNTFNPARVVLGGFLASLHAADPDRLATALDTALAGSRSDVEVVRAALGADRLMIGAAELAFEPLLADPAAHPMVE